jgi:hypothetical protein
MGNRRAVPGFPASSGTARNRNPNDLTNAKWQYERYLALAQAAVLRGDAVAAQNFYQHAEHLVTNDEGTGAIAGEKSVQRARLRNGNCALLLANFHRLRYTRAWPSEQQ